MRRCATEVTCKVSQNIFFHFCTIYSKIAHCSARRITKKKRASWAPSSTFEPRKLHALNFSIHTLFIRRNLIRFNGHTSQLAGAYNISRARSVSKIDYQLTKMHHTQAHTLSRILGCPDDLTCTACANAHLPRRVEPRIARTKMYAMK